METAVTYLPFGLKCLDNFCLDEFMLLQLLSKRCPLGHIQVKSSEDSLS